MGRLSLRNMVSRLPSMACELERRECRLLNGFPLVGIWN